MLIETVYKHKDAWAGLKSDADRYVQESIKYDNFWEKVDAILKILQPVADLIYSSKSNRVYVERTYQNWLDLENHFKSVKLSALWFFE